MKLKATYKYWSGEVKIYITAAGRNIAVATAAPVAPLTTPMCFKLTCIARCEEKRGPPSDLAETCSEQRKMKQLDIVEHVGCSEEHQHRLLLHLEFSVLFFRPIERHFGFGLMNTAAMILLAKTWTNVPEQYVNIIHELDSSNRYLSKGKVAGFLKLECSPNDKCVTFIEHVLVDMSYNTREEEKLNIVLCSPRKTCSYLLKEKKTGRKRSYETMEINRRWTFKTVHFWGENPRGTWIIILSSKQSIQLGSVSINVHGTTMYPYPSLTNVEYFKRNIRNITTDHALYDLLTKEMPDIFMNKINKGNGSGSSKHLLLVFGVMLPISALAFVLGIICWIRFKNRHYCYNRSLSSTGSNESLNATD